MEIEENETPVKLGLLEWVLCAVLIGIVVTTFSQVVFRYVFKWSPPVDTEELARYLFAWLACLGAAYGFKTYSHFTLCFVTDRLPEKLKKIVAAIVVLVMVVFLGGLIFLAVQYTRLMAPKIGPGTGLSKAYQVSSLVAGSVLMLFYIVKTWIADLRSNQGATTTENENS